MIRERVSREEIAEERMWRKRPDGVAIKMSTETKSAEFCILEFKRMSDVTDQYVVRAKQVAESQYASIISALSNTMRHQGGWLVKQVSFIAGARSLNEQDLLTNLEFFKVPQLAAGIETIRLKLANAFARAVCCREGWQKRGWVV
jgi:hypothetical protein